MKRIIVVSFLITSLMAQDETSQTFFSVVTPFQPGMPERETFFRDSFMLHLGNRGAIELVPFGGRSTNGDKLAKYFLPFGKSEILVAESSASSFRERDVDPQHLNIGHTAGTFQSTVKFCFQQTFFGLGLAFRHDFSRDEDHGIWCAVSAPVMHVRNCAHLSETIANAGGTVSSGRVANVTQAFNQAAWLYGKIDNTVHTKTGLADVHAQLGYRWGEAEESHVDVYTGVVIPTGNKPCGGLVFEPIVGNNKHFGVLFGSLLVKQLYASPSRTIAVVIANDGRHLFANTQRRSFDLMGKPWGRYQEVYNSRAAATTAFSTGANGSPGINVFTDLLEVRPGFAHSLNIALLIQVHRVHIESGYNLYARQTEKVKFCSFKEGPALAGSSGGGITARARTINHIDATAEQYDINIGQYAQIRAGDIDLASAAHPAAIGHRVYGSLGYFVAEQPHVTTGAAVGGSYEFSCTNASLDRWLVWGKIELRY